MEILRRFRSKHAASMAWGWSVADPSILSALSFGFLYWLAFLLVLEPDNAMRAFQAGEHLQWSAETFRILGASALGCAVTPLVLAQIRHFPVEGGKWRRNLAIQILGCILMGGGLILASCILADWFLPMEHRPFGQALGEELTSNGPLVTFCIAAFNAIAHEVQRFRKARITSAPSPEAAAYQTTISVKMHGRVTFLDLADVDWIEAQGNYLALHAGATTHLVRDSLTRLESKLDPALFVRVHRGIIVAANRIRVITSLGAGDAQLHLKDGSELRLSRTYRDRIQALIA
jgi:LytTr DNA-binding domain